MTQFSKPFAMKICEVQDDLAPAVHDFLCRRSEFSPGTSWKELFHYPWKQPQYPYGYALIDDHRQVQGFLGSIYLPRTINGKSFLSCNLSCWIVDETYRRSLGNSGRGIGRRMLDPVLAQQNVIATALSTNPLSTKSFLAAGFKSLDTDQIITPVIPVIRGLSRKKRDLSVSFEPNAMSERLNENDQEILAHHRALPCTHFLIGSRQSGQYCYGIGTTARISKVARLGEVVFNVCYVSDPVFLAQNFATLAGALWKVKRLAFIRYDKRLIPQSMSALSRTVACPRWYYASGIDVPQVDLAYTEFVLYNLY